MKLLIDEMVPTEVAEVFEDGGHEVLYVRDHLGAGTPDPVIAKVGDELDAIVVTWNRKDFKKLVNRYKLGENALQRLGLICFNCPEPEGRARLLAHIEVIELLHDHATTKGDPLMVEIQNTGLRVMDVPDAG